MPDFYFTFGQAHCKTDGTAMKDYWVRVEADGYNQAREVMCNWAKREMGDPEKWSWQYPEEEFNPLFFPKGEYRFQRKSYFQAPEQEDTDLEL